jgi:hypothetical protein
MACYLSNITIPSTVTYIGGSAFYQCSGLDSITIPSSVTYIGVAAFDQISNSFYIVVSPNSYTLTYVKKYHIQYMIK